MPLITDPVKLHIGVMPNKLYTVLVEVNIQVTLFEPVGVGNEPLSLYKISSKGAHAGAMRRQSTMEESFYAM